MTRPVLIVGVPRSGSSWGLKVLGRTRDAVRFNEPDNEHRHVEAVRAKEGLDRFPVLAPGDEAPAWDALWEGVFTGRAAPPSRAPRRPTVRFARAVIRPQVPVARSVHSAFAIDRIVDRWDPQVVLFERDARNVIASWLAMDIADRDRGFDRNPRVRERVLVPLGLPAAPSDDEPTHRAAWHFGVLWWSLARAAARHPGWVFASHEALCEDPYGGFRVVAEAAHLTWTQACDDYLRRSNAEGSGYDQHRVAADLPGAWRRRLTPAQVTAIEEELERFPVANVGTSRVHAGPRP